MLKSASGFGVRHVRWWRCRDHASLFSCLFIVSRTDIFQEMRVVNILVVKFGMGTRYSNNMLTIYLYVLVSSSVEILPSIIGLQPASPNVR